MTGIFYKFAKRTNSTARPSGGESLAIELKHDSSVLNPVILLKQLNYPDYNYVYLDSFSRYYWITDIVWQNGLWEITARVDVLGSWVDKFEYQINYITRSSEKYNGDIIDLQYPAKTTFTEYIDLLPNIDFGWGTLTTGYYVVGIVGKYSYLDPQAGAITYIVLQDDAMKNLMQQLFANDINWYLEPGESSLGITQSLGKMIFDPFQYIKSVRWCPIEPPVGNTIDSIEIGWWTFTPENGVKYLANYPIIERTTGYVEIKKHPKTNDRGKYLNCSRFSKYELFVPSIGIINIDSNKLLEFSYLSMIMYLDPITGKTRFDIYGATDQITSDLYLIDRAFGTFGVDINLSQASVMLSDVLRTATSNIGSIATATPSAIAKTLADFADILRPNVNSLGDNNGFINIAENQKGRIQSTFYDIVDEDNHDLGRPLCEVHSIHELGHGYYEMLNPDIVMNCTDKETEEIKLLMKGGFFYE